MLTVHLPKVCLDPTKGLEDDGVGHISSRGRQAGSGEGADGAELAWFRAAAQTCPAPATGTMPETSDKAAHMISKLTDPAGEGLVCKGFIEGRQGREGKGRGVGAQRLHDSMKHISCRSCSLRLRPRRTNNVFTQARGEKP